MISAGPTFRSDPELKQMWGEFPKEFPSLLLPKFWRDHFNRIK